MNLFEATFEGKRRERAALLYEGQAITYEALRRLTIGVARLLEMLSVSPGDRVAILLNDSPEFIASFIAVCSSGAIAVPINMALRGDEQLLILSDCTARVILIEADLCDRLRSEAQEKPPCLQDVVVVERETTTETRRRSKKQRVGIHSFGELLGQVDSSVPEFSEFDDRGPAFILYTSGSTGEPKGAIHRVVDIFYTNDTFCREVLKLTEDDRLFSSSRLPFAYGLGNSFTFPLLNGRTSVLCREKPTQEVISRILNECRPTIFFAVPVVYNLLLDYHRRVKALDCSSLRLCISAGEALPAQLGEDWEKTFGVEVLDGIGSTEMLHMWMSNHSGDVRYGSSGKVLRGYEAKLLDPEGRPTPPGQEGNLWVKGASATLGYWQRPETTALTFVDGWVRTGDLYRCDADGYWFHMGRSDDCFKSSGQWVSPVEVEGVLLRNPHVSRAAVVADLDDRGLPCACAFIVESNLESDSSLLEMELLELCRAALPRFKQPRRYVFVKELPYTATGKVQRFKLREWLKSDSRAPGPDGVAAGNENA